ncbi:MAG: hypothetical protein HRT52_23975 [Colwellia sp.]|nr:hypothetical protein [Colwellia sp.]
MWKYSRNNLNSRKIKVLTLALATLLFAFLQSHSAAATTIVKQGIKVDFSLTSLKKGAEKKHVIANSDAYFNFNITDISGAPVSGAYPAAWLQRREESTPSDEKTCKNMVKSFIN